MCNVQIIQHGELSGDLLKSIIEVKQTAWPYSCDSQLDWIKSNLKSTDLHALLIDEEGRILAYMNLIDLSLKLDDILFKSYGVGNVCAVERRKGWGAKLMAHVNSYLSRHNRYGILFCKQKLVKFYADNSWEQVPSEKINIKKLDSGVITMIYPMFSQFYMLEFDGSVF
jgi:hypothetical protein